MQQHFFCPNPGCPNYQPDLGNKTWFSPNGNYRTNISGHVVHFKCNNYGKGFSTKTFHLDYYVKKNVNC